MESFPNELNFIISKQLPLRDLESWCLTNTQTYRICQDDHFWKLKVQNDFPESINPTNDKWKQFYYYLVRNSRFVQIFLDHQHVDRILVPPDITLDQLIRRLSISHNMLMIFTDNRGNINNLVIIKDGETKPVQFDLTSIYRVYMLTDPSIIGKYNRNFPDINPVELKYHIAQTPPIVFRSK